MTEQPDSKTKIMETAIDLFASRGFRGTSIRDIAGSTGMSISNIYHYFGNKEGLLLAILERSSKNILHRLREVSELDVDPLERFKKMLTTHILLSGERPEEAKIYTLDEEHLSPEGHEANRKIQKEVLMIYLKELDGLRKAGLVQHRHLTVAAFNILGVINWALRWFRPDGPLSIDEIAKESSRFILHGLLGPEAGREQSEDE